MMVRICFGLWAALVAAPALAQTTGNADIDLWQNEVSNSTKADNDISLWDDEISDNVSIDSNASTWQTVGFIEAGAGVFIHDNVLDQESSLMEARGQFGASRYVGNHFFNVKLEGVADGIADNQWQLQVRELYADLKLNDNISLRAGQQVLTWGTGDYLFLNDFFAKDWQAMFSGREDSYLKASQAAFRLNWYAPFTTVNAVWTPVFAGDEVISGERFVYYHPMANQGQGGVVANPRLKTREPDKTFKNGQFALRLAKNSNGVEYALYGYHGFHTQPQRFDPVEKVNTYPRLNSFGGSVRRPLLSGIANVEIAYWDYLDEKDGRNPFIPNDQWSVLLGYEREIATNVTLSGQWMIQKMQDYNTAHNVAPDPTQLVDQWHHTLTARLTWLAMQQKLNVSLFTFYSPDSQDFYLKPKLSYRQDDHWQYEIGANIFGGKYTHTQWGQFRDNSNVYARVRYHF